MPVPTATYRIQLTREFGFHETQALVPYLQALGISHLYLSPVFQARSGSTHGYDVVNPARISEVLGGEAGFNQLVCDLRKRGMNVVLDIVPNHMAASSENAWWMDVLENGAASAFGSFFDVQWSSSAPDAEMKIFLPVLGDPYGAALERGDLRLQLAEAGFRVTYYSHVFPLDPSSYHVILSHRLNLLLERLPSGDPVLQELGLLLEVSENLAPRTADDWEILELRRRQQLVLKQKLQALYTASACVRAFVDETIAAFNGTPGEPRSFDLLHSLLERQPYQLAYWKVAREKINYRRFFDVSDLIGIRTQDAAVFEATHDLILRLLEQGKVEGLRVDHVDGLFDPAAYLERLQARASAVAQQPVYVVVEKILSDQERLPQNWPVAGTTGYDFLGRCNNVFVDPGGLVRLDAFYSELVGGRDYHELAYILKKAMMRHLFMGEMLALGYHLDLLAEQDRYGRDLSPGDLRRTLLEVTACLPVYRTYIHDYSVNQQDREHLNRDLADARARNPDLAPELFDFIGRVFLFDVENKEEALAFLMRWQQLSGPIMAKGVEDTTLYRYNRLLSMNDVGGSPDPMSLEQFHAFNLDRQQNWPGTMNASSTHDTKRSEDVRARLNLLSEMPDAWARNVSRWRRWNAPFRQNVNGSVAPDANEELFIYQTLLGAWPLDEADVPAFQLRVKDYMRKALREEKVHSSWREPKTAYEDAVLDFIDKILAPESSFLTQFLSLHRRVSFYGAVNSLAQTLLKLTAPGVPDFYQGTTVWDFSLVDPDNRKPDRTSAKLSWRELDSWNPSDLLANWQDGRVKAFVIRKALACRAAYRTVFDSGEYLPLSSQKHAVAFARRNGPDWFITVAPRFVSGFSALEKFPAGRRIWKNLSIEMPPEAPMHWRNVFTGEKVSLSRENEILVLPVSDALHTFPVALLRNQN